MPISSLPSLLAVSMRLASPDSAFPPGSPQVKSLCLLLRRSSNTSVPDLQRSLADTHSSRLEQGQALVPLLKGELAAPW